MTHETQYSDKVPMAAWVLGLAGLIPFGAGALAAFLLPDPQAGRAGAAVTFYAVTILSFMGGCRWGFAAAGLGEGATYTALAVSVLPALWAWTVIIIAPVWAPFLLAAGFLALLWADLRLTRSGGAPRWWPLLRWPLSLGAAGGCMLVGVATLWGTM